MDQTSVVSEQSDSSPPLPELVGCPMVIPWLYFWYENGGVHPRRRLRRSSAPCPPHQEVAQPGLQRRATGILGAPLTGRSNRRNEQGLRENRQIGRSLSFFATPPHSGPKRVVISQGGTWWANLLSPKGRDPAS